MAYFSDYPGNRVRVVVRRKGQRTQSRIFSSRTKAATWARRVEAEMDAQRFADPGGHHKETVASLLEKYIDQVCPTRRGGRWERFALRRFIRTAPFAQSQLGKLTSAEIRAWRDQRLTEVSPVSVRRDMDALHAVFKHAITEWEYEFPGGNPIKKVSPPKGSSPKLRHRRWSPEELATFLAACGHDDEVAPKRRRDYVSWTLLLALETAMRPKEICGMRAKDIDLKRRAITLHEGTTKNGRGRLVPLSKRAVQICGVLLQGKEPQDLVIPVKQSTLKEYFRQIRKEAGLAEADLRFYDIKHESISRLATKFSNVLELAAVTGHLSLQSLKFYYNPEVEELAARLD